MPVLDVNDPDDRKKIADALIKLLEMGANLDPLDLEGGENPFGDIGPSDALLNLRREIPDLTPEQLEAWRVEIYSAAQNINKFTGLVKVLKGVIGIAKGTIPFPI